MASLGVTSSAINRPAKAQTCTQAPSQSAPVYQFSCLFTHDIRRKNTKRWEDGYLALHGFNNRVMVYDASRNYIGDTYNQEGNLADGDELTLERVGVLVQVGERKGVDQTDLTDLLAKRPRKPLEGEDRQNQSRNIAVTPLWTQASNDHNQSQRRLTGWSGTAKLSTESPFDARKAIATRQDESDGSSRKKPRNDDEHRPLWQLLGQPAPRWSQAVSLQSAVTFSRQCSGLPVAPTVRASATKTSMKPSKCRSQIKEVIDMTGPSSDMVELHPFIQGSSSPSHVPMASKPPLVPQARNSSPSPASGKSTPIAPVVQTAVRPQGGTLAVKSGSSTAASGISPNEGPRNKRSAVQDFGFPEQRPSKIHRARMPIVKPLAIDQSSRSPQISTTSEVAHGPVDSIRPDQPCSGTAVANKQETRKPALKPLRLSSAPQKKTLFCQKFSTSSSSSAVKVRQPLDKLRERPTSTSSLSTGEPLSVVAKETPAETRFPKIGKQAPSQPSEVVSLESDDDDDASFLAAVAITAKATKCKKATDTSSTLTEADKSKETTSAKVDLEWDTDANDDFSGLESFPTISKRQTALDVNDVGTVSLPTGVEKVKTGRPKVVVRDEEDDEKFFEVMASPKEKRSKRPNSKVTEKATRPTTAKETWKPRTKEDETQKSNAPNLVKKNSATRASTPVVSESAIAVRNPLESGKRNATVTPPAFASLAAVYGSIRHDSSLLGKLLALSRPSDDTDGQKLLLERQQADNPRIPPVNPKSVPLMTTVTITESSNSLPPFKPLSPSRLKAIGAPKLKPAVPPTTKTPSRHRALRRSTSDMSPFKAQTRKHKPLRRAETTGLPTRSIQCLAPEVKDTDMGPWSREAWDLFGWCPKGREKVFGWGYFNAKSVIGGDVATSAR